MTTVHFLFATDVEEVQELPTLVLATVNPQEIENVIDEDNRLYQEYQAGITDKKFVYPQVDWVQTSTTTKGTVSGLIGVVYRYDCHEDDVEIEFVINKGPLPKLKEKIEKLQNDMIKFTYREIWGKNNTDLDSMKSTLCEEDGCFIECATATVGLLNMIPRKYVESKHL
jgi:hypothetical protein